jgi:molecular chaperone GrpE (heat shock protein)
MITFISAVPSILPNYSPNQSTPSSTSTFATTSVSSTTTSSSSSSSLNKETAIESNTAKLMQKVQDLTRQNEELLKTNNFLLQSNEHFKNLHKKVVEINLEVTEKIKHACRRPYSKEMLAEFKAICGNLLTGA